MQKFLADKFGSTGLIYLNECVNISQAQMYMAHLAEPVPNVLDTYLVEHPVTGERIIKTLPRKFDSSCYCCVRDNDHPANYPFEEVNKLLDIHPYYFHKADIDGNGRTDLVVDAGILVIVMEIDGRFEGHIFSNSREWNTYSFKSFLSLPDGSSGIVLNNQPCPDRPVNKSMDTVVYKFRGFMKYNGGHSSSSVSKLSYSHITNGGTTCDGATCIEINKNGQCFLKYSQYGAMFSATLDNKWLNELFSYIAFADMRSKKDHYTCFSSPHASKSEFMLHFEDGSIKTIWLWNDHRPPMELVYLSKNISDISRALSWQLLQVNPNIDCPVVHKEYPRSEQVENDCDCEW